MRNSMVTGATVGAALVFGLAMGSAKAAPFTLTTAGTVVSGTDTSGVFGAAGGNLAGRSYTLSLQFAGPGSYSYASATDATTSGSITGTLTATVGGASFSAPFANSYSAFLDETPFEIYGFNVGDNNAGSSLSGTNAFSSAAGGLPVGLSTSFTRSGGAADLPGNVGQVQFSVAGPLGTAAFTATPTSVSYNVPEPGALALAAAGLGALGLLRVGRQRTPAVRKAG